MGKKKKTNNIKSNYSRQQKIKEALLNEHLKEVSPAAAYSRSMAQNTSETASAPAKAAEDTGYEVDAAPVQKNEEPAENTQAEKAYPSDEAASETAPDKAASKGNVLLETLWFGLDYGSILTAYSLYKTVETLGRDASLMNKPSALWTDHYADPNNIAGKFIYKYCKVEPVVNKAKDLANILRLSDTVIVGSDMLWSYDVCGRQVHDHYYLDYVPDDKKKVSYATSFGYNYSGPYGEELKSSARFLSAFNAVSVGSYNDLDILRERFGIDAEIVLDPVFLCDKKFFEEAAANAPCIYDEVDRSFIFTYVKYGNPRKRELILRGNDILTPKNFSPLRNFININTYPESRDMLGLNVAWYITVEDWLYYLINSEFVITDDFYGVCFAIIFNKPFVFVESVSYDGINNVKALLSSLNLEERIINTEDDYKRKEYLFRLPIRYKKVNRLLEVMKAQSFGWLKSKLSDNEGEVI